jgi:galactokinase
MTTPFTSIAPGRLCLFGEHSDYLNLPVIAAALPLRCEIHVTPTPDSLVRVLVIDMPCLNKVWRCDLNALPPSPSQPGDFALAAVHEALADGWEFKGGATCVSTTDIPLQAGCSSSSAFTVAWVQALAKLAGKTFSSPLELAKMAHKAEVTHFGAPGGTMDHITSSLGGTLRIGPGQWQVQRLTNIQAGVWVLADSDQPKDTIGHLTRCKDDRLALFHKLGNDWDSTVPDLTTDEVELLEATRTNLMTENKAATIWNTASGEELGALMLQHHEALRDGLRLSTDRLEGMRQAAMDKGAWGFKVVGSGGGGCAVAWTPTDKARVVAKAMEDAGAVKTFVITESCNGAFVRES